MLGWIPPQLGSFSARARRVPRPLGQLEGLVRRLELDLDLELKK